MSDLNDLTIRRIYAAIGKDATLDLLNYITAQGASDTPPWTSPSLTGVIRLGCGLDDQVGAFGMLPVVQPAGTDQVAAPPLTATPLTYVGVPDNALGDTGNPDENNRLACLAHQINNLLNDLATVRTLVNSLRADLVTLGWIKGGP